MDVHSGLIKPQTDMRTLFLRWGSVIAAALSATWVGLLAGLVVRCKASGQPFPVLAKFSPFRDHLMLTDRWLTLFPFFAVVAGAFLGIAWFKERNFRSVRVTAWTSAGLILLSVGVIVLNPGGYFSWFLS